MTGTIIAPVAVPSAAPQATRFAQAADRREALPLPRLPRPRTSNVVYGLSTLDCRGRIADRAVITALCWLPGTVLVIREAHGLLLAQPDPHGASTVTPQGHLHLPAAIRHSTQLTVGDRLLLAAHPSRALLIVHPPAALDELLAPHHRDLLAVIP